MGLTYQRDATEAKHCVCLWEQERGTYLELLSDDDPSSLAVDAEGQMARCVTKTLRVCSLMCCT